MEEGKCKKKKGENRNTTKIKCKKGHLREERGGGEKTWIGIFLE